MLSSLYVLVVSCAWHFNLHQLISLQQFITPCVSDHEQQIFQQSLIQPKPSASTTLQCSNMQRCLKTKCLLPTSFRSLVAVNTYTNFKVQITKLLLSYVCWSLWLFGLQSHRANCSSTPNIACNLKAQKQMQPVLYLDVFCLCRSTLCQSLDSRETTWLRSQPTWAGTRDQLCWRLLTWLSPPRGHPTSPCVCPSKTCTRLEALEQSQLDVLRLVSSR